MEDVRPILEFSRLISRRLINSSNIRQDDMKPELKIEIVRGKVWTYSYNITHSKTTLIDTKSSDQTQNTPLTNFTIVFN